MADQFEFWLANELTWLQHITPESIRASLADFPLASKFSDRWMAGHVRRVYFSTVGDVIEDDPGRATVRAELLKIVASLDVAIDKLSTRSDRAESVLRRHGAIKSYEEARDWLSDDLSDAEKQDPQYQSDLVRDEWWAASGVKLARISPEWRTFREALTGIRSARAFIDDATATLCTPVPPRWRDQERRKACISFASSMSAVFETAFDKPATVNNWLDENGKAKLGHWPQFFARVAAVALKRDRIPDLGATLKEARRIYLRRKEGRF